MKVLRLIQRLIGAAAILFMLTTAVASAPPADIPLPLPDLMVYGTVTRNGLAVTSGTVKAVLPRGAAIAAPIGRIAGTDYSFSLAVPLSMYDPDNGNYAPDLAVAGDKIQFFIDDAPALFKLGGVTSNAFAVPLDAVGQTYRLDLLIASPASYPRGDVNASGYRDSADALLILRYDVGLIPGDETFPPAPGKLYLPLCDIVEDGKCNSSDALRILQCDVAPTGPGCQDNGVATRARRLLGAQPDAALVLRFELASAAQPDQVVARILADDPQAQLGALSLELRYDPARLAAESCVENPDGLLEAAACNASFGPGAVRLAAITTRGVGAGAALAEVTLRTLDPADGQAPANLADALGLAVDAVYDVDGRPLAWRGDGGSNQLPAAPRYEIYLPAIGKGEQ